jgi:hypothetical protein
MKMPSKGGWSPGFVSTAVHEGIPAGRDPAAAPKVEILELADGAEVTTDKLRFRAVARHA